jgi:hypothetical protein
MACGCLILGALLAAQSGWAAPAAKATVREYKKVFRTYPYSDPNPIAVVGRIYPYYRFDGYTDQPIDKEWTVVELENDYLKVMILPEIGGKIWTAIEKSTGRSFIYNNHVVKFRDIAMRGPWTSGGIEPNYGIIGHTPNCATPADYLTRTTADGSAQAVIGVLDLLTRTPWRLEVTLGPDTAYFTTRSFWYNATPIEQPYYSWMNAGIKAAGNLELIYPGTHHLGHEGEFAPWPVHPGNGKNLAFYEQNDFGSYKSYHVFGRHSEFFGAYWHDDDFGMGRYARRDEKLGKKAWIWGLSRQGMIWEHLLTDTDGQYVEVQSGRLFNQAAERSTATPFKHRGFAPYSADAWTEYWFPVKATHGFVQANEFGALNVERAPGGALTLWFSPLQALTDTLEVFDGEKVVYSTRLALKPMQTWSQAIVSVPVDRLRVVVSAARIDYRATGGDEISRPIESPKDFDWASVFGLHLTGKEWMRQREYGQAEAALEACLRKDPNYAPALVDLAIVRYRALDYQAAWTLARKALAIDTYDPAANYYYALAALALGKRIDAMDGFEVAAQSPELRTAAWIELAKMSFRQGDRRRAAEYAADVVARDAMNVDGYLLLALSKRLSGDRDAATAALASAIALDPLNQAVRFERYLAAGDEASRLSFVNGIRNEMPQETYLELAAWYHALGRSQEAARLLALAPATAETLYWLAFIQHEQGDAGFREALGRADAATPDLVFPFRAESAPVLRWAVTESASWRPKYYLALLVWSREDLDGARALLRDCGEAPDWAPFYATRSKVWDASARNRALADLEHAAGLDPRQWRYGRLLAEHHLADRRFDRALEVAARYHRMLPGQYILGMLHAKCLLFSGKYADASDALAAVRVLPYEGATEGRALHREAQLMLAVGEFRAGRVDAARRRIASAREWPENLGAGRPYPSEVDERLEDWLDARCLDKVGTRSRPLAGPAEAPAGARRLGIGTLLTAIDAKARGRQADAQEHLGVWVSQQPDARVAEWGRRLFEGQLTAWPDGAASTEEHRVLLAWMSR